MMKRWGVVSLCPLVASLGSNGHFQCPQMALGGQHRTKSHELRKVTGRGKGGKGGEGLVRWEGVKMVGKSNQNAL